MFFKTNNNQPRNKSYNTNNNSPFAQIDSSQKKLQLSAVKPNNNQSPNRTNDSIMEWDWVGVNKKKPIAGRDGFKREKELINKNKRKT
jgi:hypothetical protein